MGFEVVVRPVVFPNIRPAPAQSRPPADDPNQGIATIHGSSGQFLDLQYSWSLNSSQSNPNETKRRYDVARVYQMDDDKNVNRDTFVDIEVANRIWMDDGTVQNRYGYSPIQEADNIEIRDRNKIKWRGQ
jgi:hypothetical protein